MTFEEFYETANCVSLTAAASLLRTDVEVFGDAKAVIEFDDSSYVCLIQDDTYHVHIERDEHTTNTLSKAAQILYVDHASVNYADEGDEAFMIDLWDQTCRRYSHLGLTSESDAQEGILILCEAHPTQRTYEQNTAFAHVEWFINLWNEKGL